MIHIDLFSGIGGFAYAARQVWPDYRNLFFCEINPFCQAVLKKNFGDDITIIDDIKILSEEFDSCEQKNKKQPISETLNSRQMQRGNQKKDLSVANAGKNAGHSPAILSGGLGFVQEDADMNSCLVVKPQTPTVESGCLEKKIQTGKTVTDTIGGKEDMIQSFSNGGAPCSPEINMFVKGVDLNQIAAVNSTPTTSLRGQTTQKKDSTSTTGEPCARNVMQKFIGKRVDLLTAGVPCQPASCAGKRKGKADDRWLWGETFEVIRRFKPTWCILENVRGLVTLEQGVVFDSLLAELEGMGYEIQVFCIPACAVNAPHRRDRIWIVAHAERPGAGSVGREIADEGRGTGENRREGIRPADRATCSMRPAAADRHAANAARNVPRWRTGGNSPSGLRQYWQQPWLEVATRLCGVSNGIPAELDGLKLSASKHREERLKALGNAIVPQVAIEIMRAIKECE